MFKIGDFVRLIGYKDKDYIVTRIYDDEFIAVGVFDELHGELCYEYIVKHKYFQFLDLDYCPDMCTYREILEMLTGEYFKKDENGNYILICTEDTKDGYGPKYGLDPHDFDGDFTATE